jgi:hypothetical protein
MQLRSGGIDDGRCRTRPAQRHRGKIALMAHGTVSRLADGQLNAHRIPCQPAGVPNSTGRGSPWLAGRSWLEQRRPGDLQRGPGGRADEAARPAITGTVRNLTGDGKERGGRPAHTLQQRRLLAVNGGLGTRLPRVRVVRATKPRPCALIRRAAQCRCRAECQAEARYRYAGQPDAPLRSTTPACASRQSAPLDARAKTIC